MSRFTIPCAFAAVLLLSPFAQAQRSSPYTDRYGVLSERNIFLRDRTKPASRPATLPSRSDPERSLFLTGIVMELDGFRAYIENQNVGTVSRLAVGDSIGRGKISAIDIDAVAYEANGQTTWVVIGNDLTNRATSSLGSETPTIISSTPSTSPAGGASGGGSADAVNPNDPNLTVEQRMKLRRQQEQRGR